MIREIGCNVQRCAIKALAHRKFALFQPVQMVFTDENGQAFIDRGIVTGFRLGLQTEIDLVWYQVTFLQMESSNHLKLPHLEDVPESELEPLQAW